MISLYFPSSSIVIVRSYINPTTWREYFIAEFVCKILASFIPVVIKKEVPKVTLKASKAIAKTEKFFADYTSKQMAPQISLTSVYTMHYRKIGDCILEGAKGLSGNAVVLGPAYGEATSGALNRLAAQFNRLYLVGFSVEILKTVCMESIDSQLRSKVSMHRLDLSERFSALDALDRKLQLEASKKATEEHGEALSPVKVKEKIVNELTPIYSKLQTHDFPSQLYHLPPMDYVVSSCITTDLSNFTNWMVDKMFPELSSTASNDHLFYIRKCVQNKHIRDLALLGGRVCLVDTPIFRETEGTTTKRTSLYDETTAGTIMTYFTIEGGDTWLWRQSSNKEAFMEVSCMQLIPKTIPKPLTS